MVQNLVTQGVKSHLAAVQTKSDRLQRKQQKLSLVRRLYQQGFEREDVLNLLAFIDWVLTLPQDLEREFLFEVEQLEVEQRMQYVTSFERSGIRLGLDIRKTTLLPDSKYSFGFGAPTDLALPIIASYRVFLDKDYKWILPFNEFAEDFLQHLWNNYFRKYLVSEKTAGNTVGTKISRNQEIWESLYISAQSYLNQHLVKMVNSSKQEEESKVTQGTKGRVQAGKK